MPQMTADTAHALLSPSGASCWSQCPAALREQKKVARTSSRYADEGTAAHQLAATTLLSAHKHTYAFKGRALTGGYEATDEMCDHVQNYVDLVMSYVEQGDTLLVEQRVSFGASLGIDPTLAFGTVDAAVITKSGHIFVFDFKYGMGVRVEADRNEQLMLYGVGLIEQYEVVETLHDVTLIISQPRIEHFSGCLYTVSELKEWAATCGIAAQRALEILEAQDDPELSMHNPGEKTCRWCRAKPICPALAGVVENVTGVVFEDLTQQTLTPVPLPLDSLEWYMNKVDLIKLWCRAVEDQMRTELFNGHPFQSWKLVAGQRGRRMWADELEAEKALKALRLVQADMYSMKLASPPQIEKILKESPLRWKRLQPLITQSAGSPSVVPMSDKRPALVIQPVNDFEVLGETSESSIQEDAIC